MQLLNARIKNFRSLRDISISFEAHTALIGGNGAGKSSILKALEKFYSTSKRWIRMTTLAVTLPCQ